MRTWFLGALVSLALGLAGCSDDDKNAVGTTGGAGGGAVNPESVEAVALAQGPWCMAVQTDGGGNVEIRLEFADGGTGGVKAYQLDGQGQRGQEVQVEDGNFTWRLEGNQLSLTSGGETDQGTVVFDNQNGQRTMQFSYQENGAQQVINLYGCQ